MRRSLMVVGVTLGLLAVAACADDSGSDGASDGASAGDGAAVVTFNAGLAPGYVDANAERVPAVVEGVAGLDADVVFVQEVWTPEDVATLTDAVADSYPHTQFLDPMPDEPGADAAGPACPLDESQPLEDCARRRCGDVPAEGLADCVLEGCGAEFSALCPECQACVVAGVGSTIDEAIEACTQGAATYAYGGAFGIGFLSAEPIVEQDSLVLDSNANRRAVMYAEVDDPDMGTLHLFGTHLTPVHTDLPFPEEGSWEEEQLDQIETVREWIDTKTDGEGTIVLLGDFNVGPDGELFEGEEVAHYEALVAGGWRNAYLEAQGDDAECTFCSDNPLVDGEGDSGAVIDHVLVLNHDGDLSAERLLDGVVDIEVDGETVSTARSDHYGVGALLLP